MICNMLGCNTEAYTQVMFYHFEEGSRSPYCKQIMRFCVNHTKLICREGSFVRVQVLNWERLRLESKTRTILIFFRFVLKRNSQWKTNSKISFDIIW